MILNKILFNDPKMTLEYQGCELVSSGQFHMVANEVPGPFRKKSIVKKVLSN